MKLKISTISMNSGKKNLLFFVFISLMLSGCASWFEKEDTRKFSFEDVMEYKRRYDNASQEYYLNERLPPRIQYYYPTYDSGADNPSSYQPKARKPYLYPKFDPDQDNPSNQDKLFNKPMFN